MLVVNKEAFNRLKARTKAELLSVLFDTEMTEDTLNEEFNWEDRVHFSESEIEEFMTTLNADTANGLRAIAEHGPIIHASILDDVGVSDYASFQRSTTRRVRTVTQDSAAFFLAWDDWNEAENRVGRYAVTPKTFRSLQAYFEV
ncbi:hypothetical protein [Sphingomonas aerolata]|uniref:hypothetical protein n=1 Tax=Sphingomonas aerolata TaxID=185951 RepID=UPI002FE143AE